MLLQYLSIFFQCLLHCGGTANDKDDFMDYSMTEFWWNGTPGLDQTDRITPQYSFLPTPKGWRLDLESSDTSLEPTNSTEDLKTFFPFPNITRPSYPFDIEKHTIVTPSEPGPPEQEYWHIQYPGLTPPSNFPTDYKYPAVYRYTNSGYVPSPTGPTPRRPSFSLPDVELPVFTFGYELAPSPSPSFPDEPPSTGQMPEHSPFTQDPEPPYVRKGQLRKSSYAAADSRPPTNVVPMLRQVFSYESLAEGVPEAIRRISKIAQDADSKLKSSVVEDQIGSILHDGTTMSEKKEARDTEFENETSPYDSSEVSAKETRTKHTDTLTTVTKQSQNTEDANDNKKTTSRKNETKVLRIMKILKTPATIPIGELQQSNQTVTWTPTTIDEFLRQNLFMHSYLEMLEKLREGYMMVFLLELTRLIATKEGKAVHDVVKHTDQIIYGFFKRKQLLWFGQPLKDVTIKVARFLKDSAIDVIQYHAGNLHHMLSKRNQELSAEVNTILEYADMLYDDDEGTLLFDALKEFADYPNISLTGYWLCNSLIHNFLRPYRRLKDTQQELIDSVNLELKTRLTWNAFKEGHPLRYIDVKQADGSPDETIISTQTEPVNRTEPHNDSTWSPKEEKRKRHHRSHKRKRERKRHTATDLT